MSLISRMRRQTAVLWSQGDLTPDNFGRPQVIAPVEIKCRWEDKREEFISFAGERDMSQSLVYVDRELKNGDILLLGTLSGVTDPVTPKNNAGAFEVKGFAKLPNIRASEFLLTAYL